jgi:hypothetical protein
VGFRPATACLLLIAALTASASGQQKFTGVITDDMCAIGDHSRMRMGSTDAECTIACVDSHGALFVLYTGKDAYTLSDQKTPEKFAGKKVVITGNLNPSTKTIKVDSITAAN